MFCISSALSTISHAVRQFQSRPGMFISFTEQEILLVYVLDVNLPCWVFDGKYSGTARSHMFCRHAGAVASSIASFAQKWRSFPCHGKNEQVSLEKLMRCRSKIVFFLVHGCGIQERCSIRTKYLHQYSTAPPVMYGRFYSLLYNVHSALLPGALQKVSLRDHVRLTILCQYIHHLS